MQVMSLFLRSHVTLKLQNIQLQDWASPNDLVQAREAAALLS